MQSYLFLLSFFYYLPHNFLWCPHPRHLRVFAPGSPHYADDDDEDGGGGGGSDGGVICGGASRWMLSGLVGCLLCSCFTILFLFDV